MQGHHYYWQDSNCQDIHYFNIPLSSRSSSWKRGLFRERTGGCLEKEVVNEANKDIFDFIWKEKTKSNA